MIQWLEKANDCNQHSCQLALNEHETTTNQYQLSQCVYAACREQGMESGHCCSSQMTGTKAYSLHLRHAALSEQMGPEKIRTATQAA